MRQTRPPSLHQSVRRMTRCRGILPRLGLILAVVACCAVTAPGQVAIVEQMFPTQTLEHVTGLMSHDGFIYAVTKTNTLIKYAPSGHPVSVHHPLIPTTQLVHIHGMCRGEGDTMWVFDMESFLLYQFRHPHTCVARDVDGARSDALRHVVDGWSAVARAPLRGAAATRPRSGREHGRRAWNLEPRSP